MKTVIIHKKEKENNATIKIVINGKKSSIEANDVDYDAMLRALELLTYSATKVGVDYYKCHNGVYQVMQDITEVMVNGRDSVLEDGGL